MLLAWSMLVHVSLCYSLTSFWRFNFSFLLLLLSVFLFFFCLRCTRESGCNISYNSSQRGDVDGLKLCMQAALKKYYEENHTLTLCVLRLSWRWANVLDYRGWVWSSSDQQQFLHVWWELPAEAGCGGCAEMHFYSDLWQRIQKTG